MKRLVLVFFCLLMWAISGYAQVFRGAQASGKIQGTSVIWYKPGETLPAYLSFNVGECPDFSSLDFWLQKNFGMTGDMGYQLQNRITDDLGMEHLRFQQTWKGVPLNGHIFVVHLKNGKITALNGKITNGIQVENQPLMDAGQGLSHALTFLGPAVYKWQIPGEEAWIKSFYNNPQATFYPDPKLVIVSTEAGKKYHYAWSCDVYASDPLFRKEVFVDATDGKILRVLDRLYTTDVPGTAVTKYSGTKNITTDSTGPGSFRLRETGRGNGIRTYNMLEGSDYNAAVDFTDTDNYWNNANAQLDEAATDAHWGAEMTYDYFMIRHGRNSIDGNGFALYSYIHYNQNYGNAFWDGQRMTYGDGQNNNPFCALDICAHEITHGLDSYTANLDYADESGAMNEGFSDIFGTAVEFYAKPSQANWTCGENIGIIIRNLQNPAATQNPDTYLGNYWDPGGEVHQNSTILSHWFYLTCQGGSGTNDNGDAYSVTGIGINDAARVAYRMLSVYLISTSDYADGRFYAILSATDLFGGCTPQVEAVTDAMYAVGLGDAYVPSVVVDFDANFKTFCTVPATVQFMNQSTNATTYLWNFGDGSTSTLANPTHTYSTPGDYTVKLRGQSAGCGSDSLIQTSFVSINSTNSNVAFIPSTGIGATLTCCKGTLYDSGETGEYGNNTSGRVTIAPAGASTITLTFASFSFEQGYDYLYIYDGPNTTSPLIGQYDGSSLPNGGIINSTGNSITLRQVTDGGVTASGFELTWQCSLPNTAPGANFGASETQTCTGVVQFTDFSSNGPTSWLWNFGDGSTSTLQNPTHAYQNDGIYTVKLYASNSFGTDTLTRTSYIDVDMPSAPVTTPGSACDSNTVTLSASGTGQLEWYSQQLGGSPLFTGPVFVTPVLYVTDTFYVEDKQTSPVLNVGKPDNAGSGGYFGSQSNVHYEIFNCYTPLTLISVKVYADEDGTRTIQLRDSAANILQSLSVFIPANESRVQLNFNLPVMNKLQLAGAGIPNLYRNNNGTASYPYTLPGKISITESSASLPPYNAMGNYYYFYDWEVSEPVCSSPRKAVIATIYDCNGLDENESSDFAIYPNPADNMLIITLNSAVQSPPDVRIFDAKGRMVLNISDANRSNDGNYQLDISSLAPGVYSVQIKTGNQSSVKKLLVY